MNKIDLFENVLRGYSTKQYVGPTLMLDGSYLFYGKGACASFLNMAMFLSRITAFVEAQERPVWIHVMLGKANFCDKLLFVTFECYLEHLIQKYGTHVQLEYEGYTNITTKGLDSSPLQLLRTGKPENEQRFLSCSRSEIYGRHYRKIFCRGDAKDIMWQSKALTEINLFLKLSGVSSKSCDEISEVAAELVGNAIEHADTDCLLDIDIADKYYKRGTDYNTEYYGANICVMDFSSKLLGTQIQDKLCENPLVDMEERYSILKDAYLTHRHFFGKSYTEDDFFILSAFQNRISGRPFGTPNGGTGLPKLIKSLETQSDFHNCYALTGNRRISFLPKYLEFDEHGWLGMNESHDFLHAKPHPSVFTKNIVTFPGTAFNLNFVMAKGDY